MRMRKANSERALIQMIVALAAALGAVAGVGLLRWDLVRSIYFIDAKTIALNGFIFLLFISGVVYLIRAYAHCRFEEKQVEVFFREKHSCQMPLKTTY